MLRGVTAMTLALMSASVSARADAVSDFYRGQCVARMERSDIRERWCGFLGYSRISLALNAGYKRAFAGTTPSRNARDQISLRRMRRPWAALRHVHHLLHQPLCERVPDAGACWLVPQVMQLMRVGGEVVELAPRHLATEAEAPPLGTRRALGEFRRQRRTWPLRAVFDQDAVVACAVVAVERRQQALALDAVVGRKSNTVEECRREIERAVERAGTVRRLRAGLDPDERHPDQALIGVGTFEHQLMVTHQIAVVAGEHDHGVGGEAELIETLEDSRHTVVDHRDHAEGERDGLARLLLVHGERGRRIAVAGAVITGGMQRERMRRQLAVADAE